MYVSLFNKLDIGTSEARYQWYGIMECTGVLTVPKQYWSYRSWTAEILSQLLSYYSIMFKSQDMLTHQIKLTSNRMTRTTVNESCISLTAYTRIKYSETATPIYSYREKLVMFHHSKFAKNQIITSQCSDALILQISTYQKIPGPLS